MAFKVKFFNIRQIRITRHFLVLKIQNNALRFDDGAEKSELNFAYVKANFAMPDRELFSVF